MKHTVWEKTTYSSGNIPEGIFLAADKVFEAADRVFEAADQVFEEADKHMWNSKASGTTVKTSNVQRVQLTGKRWSTFKMLVGAAFEALFYGTTTIKFAKRK